MPTRLSYQQWTRQPQFAAPVSSALRPAFVGASDGRRNLASGRDVSTYTTSGVSEIAGLYGRGLEFTGSGSGQVLHAFPDAAAFSVLVVAELRGGGSSSLGRIVSTFDGANGYDLFFDGVSLDYGATFVGSGRASWVYAVPTSERAAVVGLSHDASSEANTPALYINGAARSLTVNAAPSGSRVAHAGTLGIGCRPDVTTRQGQGSVYLVAAWREALPAAVMTRLTANPWQLFAPRRLLVPVAAGGGIPTLSAATVFAITANSAQPRVTVTF